MSNEHSVTARKPAPNRALANDEAVQLTPTSAVSLDTALEKFDLPPRVRNACAREGITTVGDLAALAPSDIMSWRNRGRNALMEIRLLLHRLGLKLSDHPRPRRRKGHLGPPRSLSLRATTSKKKIAVKRQVSKRHPWNKGVVVGQRDAFTPTEVNRIRHLLADRGVSGLRDLALFSTAIDTMLPGCEILKFAVKDVARRDGTVRAVIEVARPGRGVPHQCVLSKVTVDALKNWITTSGKQRSDYLFPGHRARSQGPMTVRQMSRLLKTWVAKAGLDPKKFGTESLRRTKALHILNETGDLEAVRALLGHAKIESTTNYLRISPTSMRKSDPIAICRAFEI